VEAVSDLACAECGRKPLPDENAAEEWRAYLDIDDDLPVFCPQCAEREFGEEGRRGKLELAPGDVWAQGAFCAQTPRIDPNPALSGAAGGA
jgi:hypothetical protein